MGEPKPSSLIEMLHDWVDRGETWVRDLAHSGKVGRMIWAILVNLDKHHGTQLASAMAFDAFLALIPLLALGGWVLSTVLQGDVQTLAHLSSVLDVAPRAVHDLVNQHAERFSGVTLAPFALIGSIWLGSGAFNTVMAAFEQTKATTPRPWYIRRLLAIGWVIGVLTSISLAGFLALHLAGGPALIIGLFPKPRGFEQVGMDFNGARWVGFCAAAAVTTLLLASFFRIGIRRDTPHRRVWPGTLITVVIAGAASYLFAVYARTLAKFALYYGSLAAVAILLAWLWLCCLALLLGAEVNVYLEDNPEVFPKRTSAKNGSDPKQPLDD